MKLGGINIKSEMCIYATGDIACPQTISFLIKIYKDFASWHSNWLTAVILLLDASDL